MWGFSYQHVSCVKSTTTAVSITSVLFWRLIVFACRGFTSTVNKLRNNTQNKSQNRTGLVVLHTVVSSVSSDGSASEEAGSDKVLAFTTSSSGRLLALTDDSKRLVLLTCEPSWRHISTRFVARRCTALHFSHAEEELMVADKSGDVYSFSVAAPQAEGELKMGHLSMLLAVALSPDDRYIITADRDEKIRVSLRRAPYNIQSFCLGHQQFVSALLVPPGRPGLLLSGSGDGTVKLWEYESGRKLQSRDLREETADWDGQKVTTAPECLFVRTNYRLPLPQFPLDLTFDPEGRLWVLMECDDAPLRVYTHRGGCWEVHMTCFMSSIIQRSSAKTGSRFDHLQRATFDNMTAYLQKKQQRLEEQQLKRTGTQKDSLSIANIS
uniref:Uncharacterized protein n=1 Tax=Mola mola TaxID=94237 RepID=A0A3Q4BUB5_MOLML